MVLTYLHFRILKFPLNHGAVILNLLGSGVPLVITIRKKKCWLIQRNKIDSSHCFASLSVSAFSGKCWNIGSWTWRPNFFWLVVDKPPLKNMKVDWDDFSQLNGKIKNVPNHQLVLVFTTSSNQPIWLTFESTRNRLIIFAAGHLQFIYRDFLASHLWWRRGRL